MNFKKLKRLLSVVLSATMLLSTNMTPLATELTAPTQAESVTEQESCEHNWQLDNVLEEATADKEGMGIYVCNECGETETKIIYSTASVADVSEGDTENSTETEHQHTLEKVNYTAPTCWEEGIISHYKCKSCGKLFLGGDASVELTAEEIIIDKRDHQPLITPAVPGSCTVDGYKEYYSCKNCSRKYENLEKFAEGSIKEGVKGTDWFESQDDFKVPAPGHNYNSANAYTFDWTNFEPESFSADQNNNVTAKRVCGNAGCNHEENGTVKVVKTIGANYDCVKGGNVTYTATATFTLDNKEVELKTPITKSDSKTMAETPTDGEHTYEVKFNWDNFQPKAGADNKLTNYTTGVTAKRICKICQAEDTTSISATVDVDASETFTPETDLIPCDADTSIKFTASVPVEGGDPITETKPVSVQKTAHQLEVTRGTKATCETDGTNTYYTCTRCQNKFWDEDAASPFGENDSVTITKLGHSFGVPEFSWEDPVTYKAQATFKCIRSGCSAQVTVEDLDVDNEGVYLYPDATNTCGDTVTLSYGVSVLFDRLAVSKQSNGSYIYNKENATNEINYKGYVEKDDTLNHEFEKTILWNGQADEDGTYDSSEGATVTLTCKTCRGVITCNSKTGTVQGSGTLAGTTGTIIFDYDEENSQTETCTNAGKDVYNINIKCNTHDTTKQLYDISDEIVNPKPATGHSYRVELSSWNGSFDTTGNPAGITATLTCSAGDSTLSSSDESVSISFEPTTDSSLGYEPASCTQIGTDVWKVTISYGDGEQITKDSDDSPLTVSKATAKLGHKYAAIPDDWDWSEYGHADPYDPSIFILESDPGDVYAAFTCTNPSCDGLKDASDEAQAEASGINSSGRWVRKIAAKVEEEEGTRATCTEAGTVTYKASYGESSDTKNAIEEATGHNLDTSTVIWGTWEKVVENGEDVMADIVIGTGENAKTYSIPVYQITASLKCQNANCPLTNNLLSVTGRSDKVLTSVEKHNNHIEVLAEHTPNTCESEGKTIYTATATFLDDENAAIKFEDGSGTVSRTDVKLATGHDYKLEWTWKGKTADSEEEVKVTDANASSIVEYTSAALTRICKNDAEHNKTADAEVTVTKDPADAELSCTQGVIAYYDAVATLDETDTNPAGTKYTERKVIVKEALGHKYGYIMNEINWDNVTEDTPYTGYAVYWCENEMDELPENIWEDSYDPVEADGPERENVIVNKDPAQSAEPTCSTEGKIVWSIKTEDGIQLGTHEKSIEVDPDAHKGQGPVQIKWDTLTAVDRDAEGNTKFKVDGTRTCAYGNHSITVSGTATANLSSFSCGEAGTIEYTLDFGKDIQIEGGTTQSQAYEALNHELHRVEASSETTKCDAPSYPAHYRCIRCGTAFRTSSLASETVISTTALLGHQYAAPTFTWIEQGRTVQAVFTCTRGCGNTKQLVATVGEQFVDKQPTCQEEGTAYYPVDVYVSSLEDKTGFTDDYYPGEISQTLPIASHEFNSDGECIYGCGAKEENIVKITFYGHTGSVLSEKWIARNSNVEVPIAPNQIGYTFESWSIDGTPYATTAALQAAIKAAAADTAVSAIEVQAVYRENRQLATVTVYRVVDGTTEENPAITENATIGEFCSLTADEAVGEAVFSHWSSDEEGKNVLSVNRNYSLYITTSKTLYAVYITDSDEEQKSEEIVISDVYTSVENEADKLSFVTAMNMPEDATWIGSGFMYSTNTAFGLDSDGNLLDTDTSAVESALTVGSEDSNVKQKALTGRVANILTINLGVNNEANKSRNVWVRGYLFYEDSDGVLHECYTPVMRTTYNTVKALETAGN